jgi:hypothetical protein
MVLIGLCVNVYALKFGQTKGEVLIELTRQGVTPSEIPKRNGISAYIIELNNRETWIMFDEYNRVAAISIIANNYQDYINLKNYYDNLKARVGNKETWIIRQYEWYDKNIMVRANYKDNGKYEFMYVPM